MEPAGDSEALPFAGAVVVCEAESPAPPALEVPPPADGAGPGPPPVEPSGVAVCAVVVVDAVGTATEIVLCVAGSDDPHPASAITPAVSAAKPRPPAGRRSAACTRPDGSEQVRRRKTKLNRCKW